jgi:AraC-like DNA-binding protein
VSLARSSDTGLADALHDLRVAQTRYCRSELTAPWGLEIPAADLILFHFVAQGRCLLEADGTELTLAAGDLVVFPHGHPHVLMDAPGRVTPDILRLPKHELGEYSSVLVHGGPGAQTVVLCGGARFDPPDQPLVPHLPEVLHLPAAHELRAITDVMSDEASTLRPGGETVLTRLSDILLIHAVRAWLERSPLAHEGWLGALRDEHIGRALAEMHRQPQRRWTVASLAAVAHMSRSSFAERFTKLVGEAPLAYLTRRRMRLATRLLRDAQLLPAEVAAHVGYDSVPAFSRAYKRVVGVPPGAARRQAA